MRTGARTDESGGFEARLGGTSGLCKVLLRVIGLASTPAAKRSDVSTIVATVIDAVPYGATMLVPRIVTRLTLVTQ